MNKREHKHFSEYYDQETLNRVNVLLYEDFAKLSYPMISDVNKLYVNTVDTINDINDINDKININTIYVPIHTYVEQNYRIY